MSSFFRDRSPTRPASGRNGRDDPRCPTAQRLLGGVVLEDPVLGVRDGAKLGAGDALVTALAPGERHGRIGRPVDHADRRPELSKAVAEILPLVRLDVADLAD